MDVEQAFSPLYGGKVTPHLGGLKPARSLPRLLADLLKEFRRPKLGKKIGRQQLGWVLVLITVGALCSCNKPLTPTISPLTSPLSKLENETVIHIPDDGRGDTAFEAYPVAEIEARRWNAGSLLYQIPVSRIMEINLGIPPGIPGWFFMFQVPNSPLEYYVKVVHGQVVGTTEAQPILLGTPAYEYLPIDLADISLDSDDLLRLFMTHGGKEYVASHPGWQIDYRLVHLKDQAHPVWSLFDVSDIDQPAIFSVDAVTLEVVQDPFYR